MRRRAFLTSAAAGLAGLAGCLGGNGNDGADGTPTERATDGPLADPTPTGTPPPSATPTPGPGLTTTPPATGESPRPTDPPETGTPTPTDPPADRDVPTATGEPAAPERVESAWPLPAADAGYTNGTTASGPTEPVAELWSADAGGPVSAPVVADGRLYVGRHDGTVLAVDARDGSERWRRSVGDGAGVPRAVGDRLYVPTPGALVALARGDGSETWRVDATDRADVVGPDGRFLRPALLVSESGVYSVAGEEPPAVVARSLADGSERWRTDIATPWDLPIFAGEDRIFVSSGTRDSRFWRLDADSGDRLGKAPRPGHDFPAEQCYANGTVYAVDAFFGSVHATAVAEAGHGWSAGVNPGGSGAGLLSYGGDRVYYTSNSEDGPNLYAFHGDGGTGWSRDLTPEIVGRPVVAGETVVVPTDAGLRAFDPADGSDLWLRPGDATGERVVVADDLVFATSGRAVRAFRAP